MVSSSMLTLTARLPCGDSPSWCQLLLYTRVIVLKYVILYVIFLLIRTVNCLLISDSRHTLNDMIEIFTW